MCLARHRLLVLSRIKVFGRITESIIMRLIVKSKRSESGRDESRVQRSGDWVIESHRSLRTARNLGRQALSSATLFALVCVLFVSHASAQPTLRFQPETGAKYVLEFEQTSNNKTTLLEKEVAMSVNMTMELEWSVLEKSDEGNYEIEQKFRRLTVMMKSDNVDPIEFDSSQDESDLTGYAYEFFKAVKPLLENPVKIVITPRSEVVQVEIPHETMEALRNAAGSMKLRQLFSRDGIEETLTGAMAVFPEEAVAEGEAWQVERESLIPEGTLKQTHEYKLVGNEDRDGQPLAKVEVKSTLDFEGLDDKIKKPMEIKEQSMAGTLWIDPATGMVHESEFNSKLMTVTPYREHSLETEGVQTLKLKLKKVE